MFVSYLQYELFKQQIEQLRNEVYITNILQFQPSYTYILLTPASVCTCTCMFVFLQFLMHVIQERRLAKQNEELKKVSLNFLINICTKIKRNYGMNAWSTWAWTGCSLNCKKHSQIKDLKKIQEEKRRTLRPVYS